ncbi:MAG: ABC transporter permease [Peptococcaceae bacterium BRH_c4a]|nr:MAG: ABC transporter permease [Peptococcaceae bacterium BRH_c4a]
MSLFFFSLHNAFRKRAVSALAVLGVAFGTALMTFLFSLTAGMERRADHTFSDLSSRIMVTGRDAIFGGLFLGMGTPPIPSTYAEAIKKIPHVEKVYTQVSTIMRPQKIIYAMPLYGYGQQEISEQAGTPFSKIIEGVVPGNNQEMILGKSLREYMRLLNLPYEIGGVYQFAVNDKGRSRVVDLKVVGVYHTGNEVLDGAFSGYEKLARDIGKIPAGKITAINVSVDGIQNVETVAKAIQTELSGKVPEVQVVVPREVLTPLKNIMDIFGRFLMAVSLVAVIAGGLSIVVVMLLSVVSRMKEFGVLKALGWTPSNIIFMVLVESLALSILGSALGIALGCGGLALARTFIAPDIAVLTWKVTAVVCLSGIIIGVAGGIYPAFRANSATPSKILREA